jgi:hypothetical protein
MHVTDMDRQLRIEPLEKCCQHSLDLKQICLDAEMLCLVQYFQVSSGQKRVFNFAGGTHRHVQELPQFRPSLTPAPFGDIGGDGTCGPANLTTHSKAFFGRELPGNGVNPQHERVTAPPHVKFSEVLQGVSPYSTKKPQLAKNYHLILITTSISGGFPC